MKLETKEISMIIKSLPTHLHIQANGHEQKIPYNDITNSFIQYVNTNKIPPQLQENFTHLRVQIIKSENEKFNVDMKAENEHELDLTPDVEVYHREKMKHYNEVKYDFIKFKKKEHKRKIINVVNEVRNKKYENSIALFEGKNKKCVRYMVLQKISRKDGYNSFDMTSRKLKTLKDLKKNGIYEKQRAEDQCKTKIITDSNIQGSYLPCFNGMGAYNMQDNELYGNFNSMNMNKKTFLTQKTFEKNESSVYLTVFLIYTDRAYLVIRHGDEIGTHSNGYIIKHFAPKNADEVLEKIKTNYNYLGYKAIIDPGFEHKSNKRPLTKDIASRIHESPNISGSIKKSHSFDKITGVRERKSPRSIVNLPQPQSNTNHYIKYNVMPPQVPINKTAFGQFHVPYEQPSNKINYSLNRQNSTMNYNNRQPQGNYMHQDINHERNYDYNKPMIYPGDVQNRAAHNPYNEEYYESNRNNQMNHMNRMPEYLNQRPTMQQSQIIQPRQIFDNSPPMNVYHTHQTMNRRRHAAFNHPNPYNMNHSYGLSPSALYEDPRMKINPSHINNIITKPPNQNLDSEAKKRRKDEAQDMPDFF